MYAVPVATNNTINMKQFIKQYFSELIVFLGVGLAMTIILTAFAINGMMANWFNGIAEAWSNF